MDILGGEFRLRLVSAAILTTIALIIVLLGGSFYSVSLILISLVVMAEYVRAIVIEHGDSDFHFKKYLKFGILVVGIPLICMLNMRTLFNSGVRIVFWLISVVAVVDSMAYIVGRNFGKMKIFPISPSKTLEGTLAGILSGTTFGIVLGTFFGLKVSIVFFGFISLFTCILAQVGDLIESAFKRNFYLKHSSNLIPGHGGFMDRFDGYLLTAPFIFLVSLATRIFSGAEFF